MFEFLIQFARAPDFWDRIGPILDIMVALGMVAWSLFMTIDRGIPWLKNYLKRRNR